MPQNYYFSANQNAKRLHGGPTGSMRMYSPVFSRGIQYMRKTKQTNPKTKTPKKKATPFRDTGGIIGSSVGKMFNNATLGRNIGRWLGSGIGSIFGSGDYSIMGPVPMNNVLTNGNQIPKFNLGSTGTIVSHREYLFDVTGTSNFTINKLSLNPGVSATFPWLSNIAQGYQEYAIHGMIFEFRSLITDFVTSGSPGVVIMSTNYNADAPIYNSKQEMENAEYAVATKPTINIIHGIECASNQTVNPRKYIRTGQLPSNEDYKTYDLGNFQFATQGNPTQLLGELWVSYVVELFKPILPKDVFGTAVGGHVQKTGVNTANPLGTFITSSTGPLQPIVGTDSISFYGQPGNVYQVTVVWNWTTAVASTTPAVLSTPGLAFVTPAYYANGQPSIGTGSGFFASTMVFQAYYKCATTSPSICYVYFNTVGGAFGTGAVADVTVDNVPS